MFNTFMTSLPFPRRVNGLYKTTVCRAEPHTDDDEKAESTRARMPTGKAMPCGASMGYGCGRCLMIGAEGYSCSCWAPPSPSVCEQADGTSGEQDEHRRLGDIYRDRARVPTERGQGDLVNSPVVRSSVPKSDRLSGPYPVA